MTIKNIAYHPDFSTDAIEHGLSRLLHTGTIVDDYLTRSVSRLDEAFYCYLARYPFGLWSPGLVVTREMRLITETYLPMAAIRQAFGRLLHLALRFDPFIPASFIHSAANWLDVLPLTYPSVPSANPAKFLNLLMQDEAIRREFVFSNFLPKQYGGGFNRYPGQSRWIRDWLERYPRHKNGKIRCLDAACGCGEGTYELAGILLDSGIPAGRITAHGATIEPCELFAAAHGFFPHDPARQAAFRARATPVVAHSSIQMKFFIADVLQETSTETPYDLIICNGLLGGPMLNNRQRLELAIARLVAALAPGGVLLAADQFHEGWKRAVPAALLAEILGSNGLRTFSCGEGIGGVRC